jgi:hypothetical protein
VQQAQSLEHGKKKKVITRLETLKNEERKREGAKDKQDALLAMEKDKEDAIMEKEQVLKSTAESISQLDYKVNVAID